MRGWKVVIVLLTLITVLCAIGAWIFIPHIGPVLPNVDVDWSGAFGTAWPGFGIGAVLGGALLTFAFDYSELLSDRLPPESDAGRAAALGGAALGSFASALTFAVVAPAASEIHYRLRCHQHRIRRIGRAPCAQHGPRVA